MKSAEFLGWALGGLEREIAHTRERLVTLTAQADRLRRKAGARLSAARAAASAEPPSSTALRKKKGGMSAAARKRMSERMTKRWAEWRKKHKKGA
jgi:hypothetical protein